MEFQFEDESDPEFAEDESDMEFPEDESDFEFGEEEVEDLNLPNEILDTQNKITEQTVKNEVKTSSNEVISERRIMSTEELMKMKRGLLMQHEMKEQSTSKFGSVALHSPVKPVISGTASPMKSIRSGATPPVQPVRSGVTPSLQPVRSGATPPVQLVRSGATPPVQSVKAGTAPSVQCVRSNMTLPVQSVTSVANLPVQPVKSGATLSVQATRNGATPPVQSTRGIATQPVQPIKSCPSPSVQPVRSGVTPPKKPVGTSLTPATKPVVSSTTTVKNISNENVASPIKQTSQRRVISTDDIMREKRWLLAEAKMNEIPGNKFEEYLKNDSYVSDEIENEDGVEVMDVESDVDLSPDKVIVDKVIPRNEKKIEQKPPVTMMNSVTKDCRTPPKNPPTLGAKDRVNPLYQKNVANIIGRNDSPSKGEKKSAVFPMNKNDDTHCVNSSEICESGQNNNVVKSSDTDRMGFICNECFMIFRNPEELVSHWYKHTKIEDLGCSICDKSFKHVSHLSAHMMFHSNFDVHTCHVCFLISPTENDMKKHLATHNSDQDKTVRKEKLPCDICEETFYVKDNLIKHMQTHEDDDDGDDDDEFVCDDCGEIFDDEDVYFDHIIDSCPRTQRSDDADRISPFKSHNWTCDKCSEIFDEEDKLSDHMLSCPAINFTSFTTEDFQKSPSNLSGSDPKSFTCKICYKPYSSKQSLSSHHYSVHEIRKNVCHICSKSYAKEANLEKHLKTHENNIDTVHETKIDPFICEVCEKIFSEERDLLKHMKIHEAKKCPYKCSVCCESFSQERSLLKHMKSHETKKCEVCQKTFPREESLLRHLKTHEPKKCDFCEETFSQQRSLLQHMKTHKIKKCEICEETFSQERSLLKHMKTHESGNSTFKCEVCSKTFSNERNLFKHIKTHECGESFTCSDCYEMFDDEQDYLEHFETCPGSSYTDFTDTDFNISTPPKPKKDNKEKPICEICNKQFSSKQSLQNHTILHSGIKVHCTICNRGYTLKQSLSTHMKAHEKNPYMCAICLSLFPQKDDVVLHMEKHQETTKPENKETRILKKRRLTEHNSISTDRKSVKPYNCGTCSKSFSRKSTLLNHTKLHSVF